MDWNKKPNIIEVLSDRLSPVIYSEKGVEEEKLVALFEAARWAPSSYNAQPWRFFIGFKGDEIYRILLSALADLNQVWAKNAPVLMLSVAEVISSHNGRPNKYALHDVGLAVGNLLAQATHMGLYVHQMGGYNQSEIKSGLNLPESMEPVAIMTVGYKGDNDNAAKFLQERELKERIRKPLSEIVFQHPV